MRVDIKQLDIKKDQRGFLAEILRTEDVSGKKFGQLLLTTAKVGQTKGDHYHKRKNEWFCVVQGNGMLEIMDNKTKEIKKIMLGEKNMILVKIYPLHNHKITSIGKKEMVLIAYVDEVFNPKDTDTYKL